MLSPFSLEVENVIPLMLREGTPNLVIFKEVLETFRAYVQGEIMEHHDLFSLMLRIRLLEQNRNGIGASSKGV